MEKSRSAAGSLLAILNDILDFSKIEAGKMRLEAAPFQLDLLLRDLSVILSSSVGEKNVELLYDIDPAVPDRLVGDSLRLKQVLINLCGNAVKFTSRGEVVVAVRCRFPSQETARLTFSVTDTGLGIAPEQLDLIFQAFSQAEVSTSRRFGEQAWA